jgi:1-acyl-sn-glycerol-3-phosphate acyltransferase
LVLDKEDDEMIRKVFSFFLSLIFYIFGFGSILILGSIFILLTFFIHPRHLQGYIHFGCRIILLCFGQWLIIEGEPPDQAKGPYLYLPNHESLLDIFMMGAAIPRHFCILVAEYHFKIPIWRTIANRYGGIPIERHDVMRAIGSVNKLEQAINEGKDAVIFWEGTRSHDGRLRPAKKGPFHAAKNTGVTLVPCGIDGAFEHMSKTSYLIHPGIVVWRFGEPITFESNITAGYGHLSVEEIGDWVRTQVGLLTGEFQPHVEF